MSGVITKPLGLITNYLFRISLYIVFGVLLSWVALKVFFPQTEFRLLQAVIGSTVGVVAYDLIGLLLNYIESKYNKE